ncbi:MAG TPA: hypothetical protein PLY97_04345, partial [Acidocella sp.]|nr:hypothetical protein [Acidocella sp.]
GQDGRPSSYGTFQICIETSGAPGAGGVSLPGVSWRSLFFQNKLGFWLVDNFFIALKTVAYRPI